MTAFLYLLNVIIQSDDSQGGGKVGAGGDGCSHWGRLTHIALIGGKLEIWSLIVLIQNLDNEVSKCRQGVSVVLLGLRKYKKNTETVSQCETN